MAPFRRGYNRIVYFTGIALVIITLGIEYFQYNRHQQLILTDLKNRLDEHTLNVNLRARTVQGYVNGLKTAAENTLFYIKKFGSRSPLFPYLKNDPEGNSYYLDVEGLNINKKLTGNLMGLGSIQKFSENLKIEINMALMLNTFFEIAMKNNRGAAWAYYTSKNHFQNLYPWAPLNLTPQVKSPENKPFYQGATPEKNPNRLNFWTPAYQDGTVDDRHYRRGKVVTNSSPVYDGDRFLGSISLDLSLAELNRVMKRFDAFEGKLLLINKDHQILATNDTDSTLSAQEEILKLEQLFTPEIVSQINQEIKDPAGWFSFNDSSLIYVKNLHEAPWFIVYMGSKYDIFMHIFFEALQDIFVIILLLMFVLGMGYFIVIQGFISPAQKLVDHITEENRGVKSVPQNLPPRWQHWFDIVSRIFTENRMLLTDLEKRVKMRTKQLQQKNKQLETTLTDLKKAQNQIIIQEKLASLGSLTAGIAHEIKNPLNFIINFSELSLEYLHELRERVTNENELFSLIETNMTKTREHAERADSIVKGMLAHARGSRGEITMFNLNKLLDEAVNLACLGFQDKENFFTPKITKDFDQNIGDIQGSKQDLTRVFLNIVNNACFAMQEKQEKSGETYKPELIVRTKDKGKKIEINFEDNGPGMSPQLIKKIFNPFFTTKDAGQGTGLGLSISYDIITHQYRGRIQVKSKAGSYSRFTIELPKTNVKS